MNEADQHKHLHIGLWGTGGSGKTTYIAMLYFDYLSNQSNSEWEITALDDTSRHFIQEARERIFEFQLFPEKTVDSARYTYQIRRKEAPHEDFIITFYDTAGEHFEDFIYTRRYYDSQHGSDEKPHVQQANYETRTSKLTHEQIFQDMLTCDGMIVMIDPGWHERRTAQRPLDALLYKYFDDLRNERFMREGANIRQASPIIALTVSKVDGLQAMWEDRLFDHSSICFRLNGQDQISTCAQSCPIYRQLGHTFMVEQLPDGLVPRANIGCFAISSIGRAANGEINVGRGKLWDRPETPQPILLDTQPHPYYSFLDDELDNTDRTETYEPHSINDKDKIRPFGLEKPLEWLRQTILSQQNRT